MSNLLCKIKNGSVTALFVSLFAIVFAMIEIEVEGTEGWAKNLPTARNVLGHLTLYHVYMVLLAILIISGFVYFQHASLCQSEGQKCVEAPQKGSFWADKGWPALKVACKLAFHLVAYFLVQDFLWFVLNPGYTLAKYTEGNIPWHKPWWGGTPAFNFLGVGILALLSAATLLDANLTSSAVAYVVFVGLACAAAPLYHMFYNKLH